MDFVSWLTDGMNENGWNQAELARRGKLTTAQVARVINRQQNPGIKFCEGIAHAFNISLDEVLRHANILPEVSKRDEYLKRIEYKLSKINDPDDRATIEGMIDLLSPDKRQKGNKRIMEQ